MEFLHQVWNLVPGKDAAEKLIVLGSVVGALAALPIYWLWQKWHKTDIDTKVARVDSKVDQLKDDISEVRKLAAGLQVLKELKALLVQQAREKDAALPGGDRPGAGQAEAGIEKDIGAAIATLAEAGKTAALEALGRGDTRAADAALAAKIAEIGKARGRAAKEEAALYRQRGALAYLNEPLTALPLYAKAAELDPDDPEGWNELGALQVRTGALDAAIQSFETVLRLGNQLEDRSWEAVASCNLGVIHMTRGDLAAAEAFFREALEIAEAQANKEQQAAINGNLGEVYRRRGDLDAAEASCRKTLEMADALGYEEGMASQYGNLGEVYRERGDLDEAETFYRKALEIDEALGRKEGMAIQNGNLGIIHDTRGDLDAAKASYRKAIALYEQIGGTSEGLASFTGNLGILYEKRGDIAQACAHWRRARDMWRQIGHAGEAAEYEKRLHDAGCPE